MRAGADPFNLHTSSVQSPLPTLPGDAATKVMLCLGTSITRHPNMSEESHYPALLQAAWNQPDSGLAHSWRVINAGKYGDCSSNAIQRLSRIQKENTRAPDILMVELGANDFLMGHPLRHLKSSLQKSIDIAAKWNEQMRVIVGGMIFSPEAAAVGRNGREELNRMFAHSEHPVPKFDGDEAPLERVYRELERDNPRVKLIPFILDGVLGKPDLMRDIIHPNEQGHRVMFENVNAVLRPIALGLEQVRSLGPALSQTISNAPFAGHTGVALASGIPGKPAY